MSVTGIVAVSENLAIGKSGKLPWHYSSDLKFFKRTTLHNAVVMGSTTWKGIGKPLPKRLNIVLSRKGGIDERPGVLHFQNTESVLALEEYLNCDLFVIGGSKTYESFAGKIERWIVTEIPKTVEDADTFMPADFLEGFELLITEDGEKGLKIKTYGRKG
ncbi:MAG: dihydrofolate reductase [Acidobacteria bacterium]|nr:MAG: dihydrofolate reductase [Acidobacteriota bacterium]REJ99333.1 MAG: dihydrofolate reductase [Acidobacteriota bacterium]REK15645.1 MAG: dihydrofolate reductase [Acidobacteriota bacterium]REK43628.1 MAG: dihydrofolate reductase [Acidobacteriota bacterium]